MSRYLAATQNFHLFVWAWLLYSMIWEVCSWLSLLDTPWLALWFCLNVYVLYLYVCIYVCMYVYMYVCMRACCCIVMYIVYLVYVRRLPTFDQETMLCIMYMRLYVSRIHKQACTQAGTRLQALKHTHACMHARVHTHTHTHTHTQPYLAYTRSTQPRRQTDRKNTHT